MANAGILLGAGQLQDRRRRLRVTKVAVLDEREIWAKGFSVLVQSCGFELAGVWSDPSEALRDIAVDSPDLVVLGASIAQRVSRSLGQLQPRPFIILVVERGEMLVARVLVEIPFEGLLVRDTSLECARACLTAVADGHAWLDPSVVQAFLSTSSQQHDWQCLSARELEVAKLAAKGLSNKHIARELSLSDGTVKMHMHHILAKLHMGGRAELLDTSLPSGNPAN